jgi:hypothetical protein
MLYAGSKFSKFTSNPAKFMKPGGYTTSSITINEIIDQYGLEIFEVLRLKEMKDPYTYETKFLQKVDARNNSMFYNEHNNDNLLTFGTDAFEQQMIKKYGVSNISQVPEIVEKRKIKEQITKSDSEWQTTVWLPAMNKRKEKINTPEWKETVGKEAQRKRLQKIDYVDIGRKISEKRNDPVWKETVGKEVSRKKVKNTDYAIVSKKNKSTKNDPVWKETVGKEASRKITEKRNDPVWKETVGKEACFKLSTKLLSIEWKENNFKVCEHCKKGPMNPSNYSRWHGDKCKLLSQSIYKQI